MMITIGAHQLAASETDITASMERGHGLFTTKACFACHGPDAAGTVQAPSLLVSDLVVADASVPIRIVLHGMTGDRDVDGKQYRDLMMPPNGAMVSDQELADILTWIRVTRTGDHAHAVTAEMVQEQREAHAGHGPWPVAELTQ